MSSSDQVCSNLHPMQIVQRLHACIPTRSGDRWQEWLSHPVSGPPDISPRCLDDSNFRDEYLFAELLSKYTHLPVNIDRQAVAVRSFVEREQANKVVNASLANLYLPVTDPLIPKVLRRHRRFMRRILGSFVNHASAVTAAAYFGPGTNVGVRFGASALIDKVNAKLTCTEELAPYALSICNENDFLARALLGADGPVSLLQSPVTTCRGAKLAFVPKNAKTDRSITVEPLFNSFVQNGVGKVLRALISRRTSMTLDDQRPNQVAASNACRTGYATVDLKDASNSMTIELVRNSLSLCRGWFHFLDLSRSKHYTCKSISNDVETFQLFAGMGNGFTFPLESLIFFSLAKAVCQECGDDRDPIVYGDDILVPVCAYDLLTRVFSSVGLGVNVSKTYADGDFRESCGRHYFRSIDVTPFYIRKPPDSALWYFTVHNNIWKWACRDGTYFDSRVIPVLEFIRSLSSGTFVHPDLGDVGYFPTTSKRTKLGVGRWTVTTERGKPFLYKGSKGYWCALHQALSSIGQDRSSYGEFIRRGGKVTTKRQRVIYSDYTFPYILVDFSFPENQSDLEVV